MPRHGQGDIFTIMFKCVPWCRLKEVHIVPIHLYIKKNPNQSPAMLCLSSSNKPHDEDVTCLNGVSTSTHNPKLIIQKITRQISREGSHDVLD